MKGIERKAKNRKSGVGHPCRLQWERAPIHLLHRTGDSRSSYCIAKKNIAREAIAQVQKMRGPQTSGTPAPSTTEQRMTACHCSHPSVHLIPLLWQDNVQRLGCYEVVTSCRRSERERNENFCHVYVTLYSCHQMWHVTSCYMSWIVTTCTAGGENIAWQLTGKIIRSDDISYIVQVCWI